MFVDEATIHVIAGKGGHGCVSLHREKYRPKGGPDGGDGGRGGNIVLKGDSGLKTLLDFQWRRHYRAPAGTHGQGGDKSGKDGTDMILRVPLGTIARSQTGLILGEITADGETLVIAGGGIGGRGNVRFATPVRKAPLFAEKGEPGDEDDVTLELKLLADVGLIGYPNAGKSTLISRISAAKPKIASYPFTTIQPNLGVVRLEDDRTFVVADIPGIIEGAHRGKGLGDKFLRHVERTAILLHLVDMSGLERPDPEADYEKVRLELAGYGAGLADRPEIVVGTKADLPESEAHIDRAMKYFKAAGKRFLPISALSGTGMKELLYETAALVDKARAETPVKRLPRARIYRYTPEEEIKVEQLGDHAWRVINGKLERMVRMTDWLNDEAVDYMRDKLIRLGVDDKLAAAGASPGDEVVIAEMPFEFQPFKEDGEDRIDRGDGDVPK